MEIVTNIVAADEDEYSSVGESLCPLDEWSGIGTPGLDTPKIATLHALLTGDSLQESLDRYEPVYVSVNDSESEIVILQIADEVLERLAELDEDALENVAGELASAEEFETGSWGFDAVLALLTALSEIAQLAESQGQVLFVWMYLRND